MVSRILQTRIASSLLASALVLCAACDAPEPESPSAFEIDRDEAVIA